MRCVRWCPGRIVQKAWKTIGWPPFETFAGSADVYHFPNFIIPPLKRGKAVVSIHDMSFMRFPDFAEERNRQYLTSKIRDTVRRAAAVITISEFSASEVRSLLPVSCPVRSVHLGVTPHFHRRDAEETSAVLRRYGIEAPYILTVGTLEPRKNIPLLVETFERMTAFDGRLVIAGMRGWKFEPIEERMRNSSRADRISFLDYIDEADLPALYSAAELFAMPSFYEGFGLPPVEAMACGTPVLTSPGGSLREVLGDGALVVEEFDADLWAEQAMRILTDSSLRADLVRRGSRQAAKYDWAITARKTWDIYREVACT